MNREELKKEETILKLFAVLSLEDNTKWTYCNAMQHYTEFTGKTPTELIDEAKEDIKAGLLMTDRKIFLQIAQFRQHLEKQKNKFTKKELAPGTIQKYVSTVISFYNAFYIETPKQPRSKNKVKPQKENMKRIDKDGIRHAHKHANLRDRAISLCGVSSGMGAAEISSLTYEAFEAGQDDKTGITTFDMRRRKVGVDFITFISPEATKAVLEYIEWRNRLPKTNSKNEMLEYEKRKVTPESYLFISNKVKMDYLETRNEELRRLSARAISNLYTRISESAGISTPKGCFNTYRSHNMRKLFTTTLKNQGCDSDMVEYFCGHTLGDTKNAYYEGDPDKLKIIYQKFIPYITIQKELDISESPEYQDIVRQNQILRTETERHIVDRQEMADLYRRMTAMGKTIEGLEKVVDRKTMEEINYKAYKEAYKYADSEYE